MQIDDCEQRLDGGVVYVCLLESRGAELTEGVKLVTVGSVPGQNRDSSASAVRPRLRNVLDLLLNLAHIVRDVVSSVRHRDFCAYS